MTDQRASNAPVNFPAGRLPHWRRVCGFGLLAVFACVNEAQAQEPTNRLKFPSLFRRSEQPATQAPVTSAARRESDNNRVLTRARQLMAEARTQESGGRFDLALDLASRAEGVYQAAQRTTDARWPASEQTPAEYVRVLEKRLLASAASNADARVGLDADDRELPVAQSFGANPISKPMSPSKIIGKRPSNPGGVSDYQMLASDFGKTQRPATTRELPESEPEDPSLNAATNHFLPTGNKLLDWTQRGRQALQTIEAVKDVAEVVTGEPLLPDRELPDAGVAAAEPTKVDRSLNAAKSVLDRLDHLNSWQSVGAEKPVKGALPHSDEHGEPPLPDDSKRETATHRSPMTIPDLIDSPGGISDAQVGPIPTHFDSKMEDRSNGLEIGAPEKVNGSGASRAANFHNDLDPHGASLLLPSIGHSKADSTEAAVVAPRSLWVTGTVQAIATFFGVLGAIVTVLIVKSLQRQKQLASSTAAKATATEKPMTQPAMATVAATVTSDLQTPEAATVPFRVVGANGSKTRATTPTAVAQPESPVKSVFDQNVELLDSLNQLPIQKAA